MSRHIVAIITIILFTMAFSFSFAFAAKFDMVQILSEGDQIIKEKKSIEEKIEGHQLFLKNISRDAEEYNRQMNEHNNNVRNFNARCQRTFKEDEEGAYASCQGELSQHNSNSSRLNNLSKSIFNRKKNWESKAQQLNRQYDRVKARFKAWERSTQGR